MTHVKSGKTESETLFEHFCTHLGISYTPIPCTNKKAPDYEISLSDHIVVTELKQFDPSNDDDRLWAEARSCGSSSRWERPGRRVRRKIQDCNKQLKARSKGKFPTLLVLYDNGTVAGVDATDIKTAMYGDEKVVTILYGDEVVGISDIHPGGGRKCTANCNTSISAIALMYCVGDKTRLSLYHNHFAANPIDPEWQRGDSFQHFAIDPKSDFKWIAV